MHSVPIATKVVSLNPAQGEVYSMQHYVIKFVNDLRQVCGILRALWFPPTIKAILDVRYGLKKKKLHPVTDLAYL
jgi:hypothetical protein